MLSHFGPGLCTPLDQALSALIQDLHDRGLLESTLIVWMGEFGRTLVINPRQERSVESIVALLLAEWDVAILLVTTLAVRGNAIGRPLERFRRCRLVFCELPFSKFVFQLLCSRLGIS